MENVHGATDQCQFRERVTLTLLNVDQNVGEEFLGEELRRDARMRVERGKESKQSLEQISRGTERMAHAFFRR